MLGVYCIEVWKPVFGFVDYEVSSFGRIRTWRRLGRPAVRKTKPSRDGYVRASLTGPDGKEHTKLVHILVARAFVGETDGHRTQVRHLDGNRSNNHRTNIALGTSKENHADRNCHGTNPRCERAPSRKLTVENVLDIFHRCSTGTPRSEMANKYSVDIASIRKIMRGNTWAEVTGVERRPR